MGITIPERTKLKGQTPAQLLNGHRIHSSSGEEKALDEWIKVLALSSMQVLCSKRFALMVEGYTTSVGWAAHLMSRSCCLSWSCTDRGRRIPACRCLAVGGGGSLLGRNSQGCRENSGDKRRWWGYTESIQDPFSPPPACLTVLFWAPVPVKPSQYGNSEKESSTRRWDLWQQRTTNQWRKGEVRQASNKDQENTRNVYFCCPAYTLVKPALVSTACVFPALWASLRPMASYPAKCFTCNTCNNVPLQNEAG